MTCIIDYGVGNLFSLKSSLCAIGNECIISNNIKDIENSSRIILPGVGAFGDAADKLCSTGLDLIVKEQARKGKPLLGICLGMQLLFEESYEYGVHSGLGLIKGNVVPMSGVIADGLKIPQIGWNVLKLKKEDNSLFKYIKNNEYVYFVHSYYASECDDSVIAVTDCGIEITAAVSSDNVFGCQFHPEKSGNTGLNILRAFCEMGDR